jgi:hypothetical protein
LRIWCLHLAGQVKRCPRVDTRPTRMLLTDLPDDAIAHIFNYLRKGSSTCCPGILDSPDALSLSSSSHRFRKLYAKTCLHSLRLDLCQRHISLSRAAALCRIAGGHLLRVALITRNTSGTGIATSVPLHVLLDVLSGHCRELQAIDLTKANNLNWHSCPHAFRRLLHVCTKLKGLHIGSVPQTITRLIAAAGHNYTFGKQPNPCIELQELSLLDFSDGMDGLFRAIAPFQNSLKSLSISGGTPNVPVESVVDCVSDAKSHFHPLQAFGKLERLYVGPMLCEPATTIHVIRSLVLSSRISLQTLVLEQIECMALDRLIAQEIWKCSALKEVQLHRFDTANSMQDIFQAVGGHLTVFSTLRPSTENEIRALRQFCPSLRALSFTYSSAYSPQSTSSEMSEYISLIHAVHGCLEYLSLTKVRTLLEMSLAEYATNLRHLRLHFDVEPDLSALEHLLKCKGKNLCSLNLHIVGMGTVARKTQNLLGQVQRHCSELSVIELNLWPCASLSNVDRELQEDYLREFEAEMPLCCTKWTRVHLRAAQTVLTIQN